MDPINPNSDTVPLDDVRQVFEDVLKQHFRASGSEFVNPENVSIELIRDVFDAAMMEVTLDEEKKFIRIKEDVVARCTLSESKERVMLVAYYGIKEEAQRIDRLELANRINDQYVLIRASIDDDGDLQFDYCLVLKGGVSKKHIVQATRVFLMLVPKAVSECDEDGIVD